jgi:N-acylneuraminate cytidylyltransferase
VVSVTKSKSNPYFTLFEENEYGFLEPSKKGVFKRRQDCPDVWEYNGAIYIINIESLKNNNISNFKKVIKFEMDEISSIDLDSYLDWALAETIFKEKGK